MTVDPAGVDPAGPRELEVTGHDLQPGPPQASRCVWHG